jgi:endonuclease/exonuclease/phosphatase (EEP) superfamily protein YafD
MIRSLQGPRRLILIVVLGAATLYCIAIVVLAAMWALIPEQRWWVAVSNIFALYLFVPLLLLVPLALALRSWWLRVATAIPLAIFLVSIVPPFMPPLGSATEGRSLRVLTFNQREISGRAPEVLDAIRAQNADVVAIQEVTPDVMHRASTRLKDIYPYQEHVSNEWDLDMSILSRYPIQVHPVDPRIRRIWVTLDVDGQMVEVVNVHLNSPDYGAYSPPGLPQLRVPRGYSAAVRASEAPILFSIVDNTSGPLIVLGDHNTSEREPLYREFAARLTDAYRRTSWGIGATYPNNREYFGIQMPFPLVRIDYVWTRDITPISTAITCDVAESDHCMLVADLALER